METGGSVVLVVVGTPGAVVVSGGTVVVPTSEFDRQAEVTSVVARRRMKSRRTRAI
jgi:hypothetical protein